MSWLIAFSVVDIDSMARSVRLQWHKCLLVLNDRLPTCGFHCSCLYSAIDTSWSSETSMIYYLFDTYRMLSYPVGMFMQVDEDPENC